MWYYFFSNWNRRIACFYRVWANDKHKRKEYSPNKSGHIPIPHACFCHLEYWCNFTLLYKYHHHITSSEVRYSLRVAIAFMCQCHNGHDVDDPKFIVFMSKLFPVRRASNALSYRISSRYIAAVQFTFAVRQVLLVGVFSLLFRFTRTCVGFLK